MKENALDLKFDALRQRIAALQARADKGELRPKEALPTTLKNLQSLLEELQAALEEQDAARKTRERDFSNYQTLQKSHDTLEGRIRKGDADLSQADAALKAEIHEHARTGAMLAQRQAALEVVYRIATNKNRSIKTLSDQVVLNLAGLLNVPSAVIRRVERDKLKMMSNYLDGTFSHEGDASLACGPCAIVCEDKAPHQCTGDLEGQFSDSPCFRDHDFKAYIGVPIKESTGKVTGVLCAMDHVERVFNEEEVHLIEILARYVANEFEREVTERHLLESQRFQVLGQLTSGVAHEVRNPINAILILAEALEARLGEASEYGGYLARIRKQVHRLSNLMQDLLDLGKPLQLSRLEQTSLSTICTEAVELWRQSAPESMRTVRLIRPKDLPDIMVLAEAEKLKQVYINFIENAVQHSPVNGEILLSILPPHGDTVRVQVIDRGTGIPPENLSRVFEPFFTARKHGTGLGLSLVKQIVEAHKGEVAIWNNDPPPGCTVEVGLRVAKGTEA